MDWRARLLVEEVVGVFSDWPGLWWVRNCRLILSCVTDLDLHSIFLIANLKLVPRRIAYATQGTLGLSPRLHQIPTINERLRLDVRRPTFHGGFSKLVQNYFSLTLAMYFKCYIIHLPSLLSILALYCIVFCCCRSPAFPCFCLLGQAGKAFHIKR